VAAIHLWQVSKRLEGVGDRNWNRSHEDGPGNELSAEEERAVRIAMEAIGPGIEDFPDKWDVEVTKNADGECVVTWPVRRKPPFLGPDFHCRIYVDPVRGVVTKREVGG